MKDLLTTGIANDMFTPAQVLSLIYGNLKHSEAQRAAIQETVNLCEWNAYPNSIHYWTEIPVEVRSNLIRLLIQKCKKNDYGNTDECFHKRVLCFLHEFLDDLENSVDCIEYNDRNHVFVTKRRYSIFTTPELRQAIVTEVFLWWYLGLRKREGENLRLNDCWVKYLDCELPASKKHAVELINQRIAKIDEELKKIEQNIKASRKLVDQEYPNKREAIKHRHISSEKKKLLLKSIEGKDEFERRNLIRQQHLQEICNKKLQFLKGYLDFLSITEKLKKTVH